MKKKNTRVMNYGVLQGSSWYRLASCGIGSPPTISFQAGRSGHGLGMNFIERHNVYGQTTHEQRPPPRVQTRRADAAVKITKPDDYIPLGENKYNHIARWYGDNLTFGGRDEGEIGDLKHSIQTDNQTTWSTANVA